MVDTSWPLIIVLGGSQQSNIWYQNFLKTKKVCLLSDVVANHFNGFCINLSWPGASNRRHIRRSMIECITQRELNPNQRIILILELSFALRKELWVDDYQNKDMDEANFFQIQIANDNEWWKDRGDKKSFNDHLKMHKKYFDRWLSSQRYFYSSYGELINLYQDILSLIAFLKLQKIDYIIFQGNPVESFEPTFIKDIFKKQLDQYKNVLDLEKFSFTEWCISQNFVPIDSLDRPFIGHPSPQAHEAFAKQIIIPLLS